MTKARVTRVMGNYHARFGSGGGVGDCPADHNARDAAIAASCSGDFCICSVSSVVWPDGEAAARVSSAVIPGKNPVRKNEVQEGKMYAYRVKAFVVQDGILTIREVLISSPAGVFYVSN